MIRLAIQPIQKRGGLVQRTVQVGPIQRGGRGGQPTRSSNWLNWVQTAGLVLNVEALTAIHDAPGDPRLVAIDHGRRRRAPFWARHNLLMRFRTVRSAVRVVHTTVVNRIDVAGSAQVVPGRTFRRPDGSEWLAGLTGQSLRTHNVHLLSLLVDGLSMAVSERADRAHATSLLVAKRILSHVVLLNGLARRSIQRPAKHFQS